MEEDRSMNVIELIACEFSGYITISQCDSVFYDIQHGYENTRATYTSHTGNTCVDILEPHVQRIHYTIEGTYYDTVDEAVDMYTKYAEMGGFEVKKSGQRLTKSGAVKHKYIMCNREGVPKGINVDTLDPEYSDKQKRNTTAHVTGCKARIKLVLNIVTGRYKYNMKFVPFIGVDNHGKCVTLGSRMLLHEDTKSYTWLLKSFMTAFLKEPTMIVTDQDGAMKRAIEAIFTKAKHRLCMCHIMQKIPSKIPTYFIDSPLYGLMRTTSRSKIENSFFKSFTSPGATLVSFMMSYESAMERQRYRQEALDFKTIDAAPKCETKLAIERHVARVYTRTIFLLVQTEIIEGCWSCTIQDLKINEGCETVIIRDKKPNDNRSLNTKKGKEQEKKTGIVAEAVKDYKNCDINVIPKQYILRRWTRDIIPPDLRRQRNRYGEIFLTIKRLTNETNFLVDDCLFLLSKDEGRMSTYVEKLKKLLDEVKADMPNPPSRNTGDVIGGIFSISKPNQVDVKNPTKAVNKGEHLKKGERLKSEREKALKVRAKPMKVCGYYKEKTNEHTKTTCPKNLKARKKKKATPVIDV
ncbi:FAR1-related sequence 5-like protein [Tanacetum coccineum]